MSSVPNQVSARRVAVIGAGSWGTTLGSLAAGTDDESCSTVIWAREPEVVRGINEDHANEVFLAGHRLPDALVATSSLAEALAGADAVIVAVPSQFFRPVFQEVAVLLPPGAPVLSVVKGIERGSLLRMTQIMEQESDHDPDLIGVLSGPNVAREVMAGQPAATVVALRDEPWATALQRRFISPSFRVYGVLSGPNVAREVMAGQPAATVVALRDEPWATALQRRFISPSFRVYTNPDVVGCEIAGAVKNVIAIAAGIADGLGFGSNTKAALLTRGLAELSRLGVASGGDPLTFLGLAGNGDLIATCSSPKSRNHGVGYQLGQGRRVAEIVAELHMVAEGVETTPGVLALAERAGVEMPIAHQVNCVIEGTRSPEAAVELLMNRRPRAETGL